MESYICSLLSLNVTILPSAVQLSWYKTSSHKEEVYKRACFIATKSIPCTSGLNNKEIPEL